MPSAAAGQAVTGEGAADPAYPGSVHPPPGPPGENPHPLPGPPGEDPQPPPRPPGGERLGTVVWSFVRCLAALLPVYLAGYWGFSILLVLLGLLVYMGWKHSRLEKVMRLKSAMYLLENERQFTMGNVMRTKRDLPPWVRNDNTYNIVYSYNIVVPSLSVRPKIKDRISKMPSMKK